MKKLYRTASGQHTGTYYTERVHRPAAHIEVYAITGKGDLLLDRIHGTAFDDTVGGLRAMTPEEAHHFAAESNAKEGWKVGDIVAGEHVELQG